METSDNEETTRPEQNNQNSPQITVNMVAHFVCVLYTAYVIYKALPGTSLFSWHPTLMSIAYMFFMAESILIYSPQSSLLRSADRATKMFWHWVVMVIGLACAGLGVAAIWYNKERNGSPHMTSNHGTLGYVLISYTATQCTGGLLFLFPEFSSKLIKLVQLKQLHATSGCILYFIACVTLLTGMQSTWFTNNVTGTSWYACLACPIIMFAIVVNQVAASVLGRMGPRWK